MIHIHASGVLLSAPQSRTSAKGAAYTTGMLKSTSKDGDAVVSFIAFSESEQQALLDLAAGDALTVAGLGKLTQWTAKDGSEKHGLSVVADRVLAHAATRQSPVENRSGQRQSRQWPPQARQAATGPAAERAFNDTMYIRQP